MTIQSSPPDSINREGLPGYATAITPGLERIQRTHLSMKGSLQSLAAQLFREMTIKTTANVAVALRRLAPVPQNFVFSTSVSLFQPTDHVSIGSRG